MGNEKNKKDNQKMRNYRILRRKAKQLKKERAVRKFILNKLILAYLNYAFLGFTLKRSENFDFFLLFVFTFQLKYFIVYIKNKILSGGNLCSKKFQTT